MKDFKQDAQVLIVDDNLQNLQIIGKIVKESSYRPALTQSGQQALDFLEKKLPDLILLDIMMPEMNGIEVCRRIKGNERTKNIPIIFITALSDTRDVVTAFKAGGVDYITKPFVKEEVQARIKVHIKLKRAIEKMEDMAVTDEMTGVYNRRYAFRVLAREMARASREKSSFVLCFIDVDNLKYMNDTYGHEAGDRLILEVVNSLKEATRTSDYIFRMGGDEFLLLLLQTDIEEVVVLLGRLHGTIHQRYVDGVPIDFSYGLSEFLADDTRSAEALIQEADMKMYEQKLEKKKNK